MYKIDQEITQEELQMLEEKEESKKKQKEEGIKRIKIIDQCLQMPDLQKEEELKNIFIEDSPVWKFRWLIEIEYMSLFMEIYLEELRTKEEKNCLMHGKSIEELIENWRECYFYLWRAEFNESEFEMERFVDYLEQKGLSIFFLKILYQTKTLKWEETGEKLFHLFIKRKEGEKALVILLGMNKIAPESKKIVKNIRSILKKIRKDYIVEKYADELSGILEE